MPAPLQYVEDGDWNRVRLNTDTTARLLNPPVPQARVFNNAAIATTTSVAKVLTFNSERWDNGDLHSTSVNTERLTAPITGLYMFGANVQFASNATGWREVDLRISGTTTAASDVRAAVNGAVTITAISAIEHLIAGDYVEVVVAQNSGGNLNVSVGAQYSPEFWMVRLAGYVNQGV